MTSIPLLDIFAIEKELKALNRPIRIGFCEPGEQRVQRAIELLQQHTSFEFTVTNTAAELAKLPRDIQNSPRVHLIDCLDRKGATLGTILSRAKLRSKKLDPAKADQLALSPVCTLGSLLVDQEIDGAVSGCFYTTADVIRAGLRTVGLVSEKKGISSSFLFAKSSQSAEPFMFADCGVIPSPDAGQLASIALQTHIKWTGLFDKPFPGIAFLSYATGDSASGELVEKVRSATSIAKKTFAKLGLQNRIYGPVQFDSAFVPAIGRKKGLDVGPENPTRIYIFPDLNAANIAYKIANHLGGYDAYGPLLQGLAKPFTDCSRGASVEEIAGSAVIVAIEASRQLAAK